MVMSITFALQQKHQDEQNSLYNAVQLFMQSPSYIQMSVKHKKTKENTGTLFFKSSQVGDHINRFHFQLVCFLFSSWTAH